MVTVVGEDPQYIKTASCSGCAARLQYTCSETQKRTVSDYGGGRDTYSFIVCPRCSKEVIVSEY